ncbi:MAG TPA: hypothetical protein VJB57_02975 [Dehalococcoidia bacterium]|nr:hypothetical protein [Dehalococcoidia bacterium]
MGIKKTIAGALVVGALSLTSALGGTVHADSPSASQIHIKKMTDKSSPTFHEGDGRDFLYWQRGHAPDGSIPTETLSMNFDK